MFKNYGGFPKIIKIIEEQKKYSANVNKQPNDKNILSVSNILNTMNKSNKK